jgi:Fic family protein
MLIGEAVSKAEHIAGVPLNPDFAKKLHRVYLAKGVLATVAIEGNTLTEDEVRDHLDGLLKLPPSRQYLGREIDNIVNACNRIGTEVVFGERKPILPETICEYNKQVLSELPVEEDVVPGQFRYHSVVVGRYKAVPAECCQQLLEGFCKWLNTTETPEGMEQEFAVLMAIAAHLYFVWIHPFGDGNGRTARLLEFRYLLQAGFPTPTAHLLSNFYNQTRTEYYRQLDYASRSGGDMSQFIAYAAQGLVDQLKGQLKMIRDLQHDAAWTNFVYTCFDEHGPSPTNRRRRQLVLALSSAAVVAKDEGWVRLGEIRKLTPDLNDAYQGKTAKTLSRDLNALEDMRLTIGVRGWVRANREIILAFLPKRLSTDKGPRRK